MKLLYLITILIILSGCAGQIVPIYQHVDSHVGSQIEDIRNLYTTPARQNSGFFKSKVYSWKETISKFTNGSTLYSYSNPYLDCEINWIADKSGIIINGSYKGKDCN